MKVQLKDLPSEGKTFSFSSVDGRLNEALKDLVGSQAYEVEVFVQPIGGAFAVKGKGHFQGHDLCSLCGWETSSPLTVKIDEYLVVDKERGRTGKSIHGSSSLELGIEGPETTYLPSHTLDLGEFCHEQFALVLPAYPQCSESEACEARQLEARKKLDADVVLGPEEGGHPAFKVLGKIGKKH